MTGTLNQVNMLREKSKDLETAFLSEMLSHTGLDQAQSMGEGGDGAQQYASFIREEYARAIVDHGGIGLAETIFKALISKGANDGSPTP